MMALPRAAAAFAADPLARLRGDLLTTSPGPWPRGAVGAHGVDGSARYAYPEIAGYWLQWASARVDVDAAQGAAMLAWLESAHRADGAWPARVGEFAAMHAHAIFLYDHAILWHGLRCWARRRGDRTASRLADAAWQALASFHGDGGWRAALGRAPARWSGAGGPFLLKALARLLHGEGALATAAQAAIPALVEAALAAPHAPAHPQLYAIEGLLLLGEAACARSAFAALIGAHGGPRTLREEPGRGPRRADVLAQALRLGHWLDAATPSRRSPCMSASDLADLADELASAIDGRGRIAFAPGADHCPTWTQLFAEQALALHAGARIAVEDLV